MPRPLPLTTYLICLALGGALLCGASLAAAQDAWQLSAYKGWTVAGVEVTGLEKKTGNELREGLELSLKTGLLGKNKAKFYPQILDNDIDRCILFLARRGYPHVTVTPHLNPEPDRQRIGIVFEIDPGPPVLVASVVISNVPGALMEQAQKQTVTRAGDVFTDRKLNESVVAITRVLEDAGHAHATLEARVERNDSVSVTIDYQSTPGNICYFSVVDISGPHADLVPLVRKSVAVRIGQRYKPQLLEDAERNLRILGLFRQINLSVEDTASDSLKLVVELYDREPRSFEVGVRYWTDEQLSGRVLWTHRNIFKAGRGGSVGASASTIFQIATVSAWWPALIGVRTRGIVNVGGERESEEGYEQTSVGVEFSLRYDYSLATAFRTSLLIQDVTVIEDFVGAPGGSLIDVQDGLINEFSVVWERKSTDDWITPSSGTAITTLAAVSPQFTFSENTYYHLWANIAAYVPIRRPAFVFAARYGMGLAEPTGSSKDIIPSRRFFAGGSNSHRGFNRRKLGPLDAASNPIGGEAMVLGSFELRYPLFWKFRATTFVDYGQVWLTQEMVDLEEIEVAVGQGLWIATPVGPIRGDVGYRITDFEQTQPRWVFHFSIGPAF